MSVARYRYRCRHNGTLLSSTAVCDLRRRLAQQHPNVVELDACRECPGAEALKEPVEVAAQIPDTPAQPPEEGGRPMKAPICPRCGERPRYQYRKGARAGKFDTYCRECRRALARARRQKAQGERQPQGVRQRQPQKPSAAARLGQLVRARAGELGKVVEAMDEDKVWVRAAALLVALDALACAGGIVGWEE